MIKTGPTPHVGLPDDDSAATGDTSESTYAHLGEEGARPAENVYGMASGQDLMLALGGRKRPRLETPPPQADARLPASTSDYERVDFPRTMTLEEAKRAYANRPREPLPAPKPDIDAVYESIAPAKPLRARDDVVPAGAGAKTPPPLPLKPTKADATRHVQPQAQEAPSRRGPPTPPKPASPPRSPLHDRPAAGTVAGPQLPTAIADAAAAIARRRNDV